MGGARVRGGPGEKLGESLRVLELLTHLMIRAGRSMWLLSLLPAARKERSAPKESFKGDGVGQVCEGQEQGGLGPHEPLQVYPYQYHTSFPTHGLQLVCFRR